MHFKKIFLSAAIVSMAGLVACGDDSSSNATDSSDSKDSTITSSNSEETDSSESKNEERTPDDSSNSKGNCIDKSQCEAMVRGDVSTWHFVRADAFGEPSVYIYSVADNGTDLIINIDGKEKSYSMYNMSKEIGVEMAFSAAKATCNDGMEIEGANYCE